MDLDGSTNFTLGPDGQLIPDRNLTVNETCKYYGENSLQCANALPYSDDPTWAITIKQILELPYDAVVVFNMAVLMIMVAGPKLDRKLRPVILDRYGIDIHEPLLKLDGRKELVLEYSTRTWFMYVLYYVNIMFGFARVVAYVIR